MTAGLGEVWGESPLWFSREGTGQPGSAGLGLARLNNSRDLRNGGILVDWDLVLGCSGQELAAQSATTWEEMWQWWMGSGMACLQMQSTAHSD